jgi:cytochrome c-type biogenesis protein CcmH
MITFWIIAALLIAAALLFVLPPLLSQRKQEAPLVSPTEVNLTVYRDQLRELESELAAGTLDETQYHNARTDLEGRVVEDAKLVSETLPEHAPMPVTSRLPVWTVAIALPLVSIGLYLWLGNPAGLEPEAVEPQQSAENGAPHPTSPEQIQAMVASLEQRLAEQPEDADGWAVLARSYAALQRYEESSMAYGRAIALKPDSAQLLADYADTLAMANNRSLQGEPEKLIQQALKVDPHNIKALALAGTVDYERQNYQGALKYWKRILELVPPNTPIASSVAGSIKEVEKLAGIAPEEGSSAPSQQAAQATVSGTVTLAPGLRDKVSEGDTVFVFARAPGAGRTPPLAILRMSVKDLPISFTLDDSMAMAPQFRLSTASKVIVGARISKSGNAMPSPGDFEGYSAETAVGARDVQVTIDATVQ